MPSELMRPDWPAPPGIGAAMSTRRGGVSAAPFDTFNLRPAALPGDAVDAPQAVAENLRRFAAEIGALPVFLRQVHGSKVVRLQDAADAQRLPQADASVTTVPGLACTVMAADCLPVLFCSADGSAVGAAHAGWRGLAAGVLEQTVLAVCGAAGCGPEQLLAWLGPCIGPRQFEVGAEVLEAFAGDARHFVPRPRPDGAARWLADLPGLARDRLRRSGVVQLSGGDWCTVEDAARFYSYRRDGITGRMAAAVWIRPGLRG